MSLELKKVCVVKGNLRVLLRFLLIALAMILSAITGDSFDIAAILGVF
jgi:hypothetical protein